MTTGIMDACERWTGTQPQSCPWAAFFDPLVSDVLEAYAWFESGQLPFFLPRPSHLIVEALGFYHRCKNKAFSTKLDLDREEAKAKASHGK